MEVVSFFSSSKINLKINYAKFRVYTRDASQKRQTILQFVPFTTPPSSNLFFADIELHNFTVGFPLAQPTNNNKLARLAYRFSSSRCARSIELFVFEKRRESRTTLDPEKRESVQQFQVFCHFATANLKFV